MAYDEHGVKSESVSVRFEPELVGRFWQHNATRVMRANERIMNGILSAATRELQLVQELTRFNLANFQKLSNVSAPEKAQAATGQNVEEFEHILAGLRAVTEELWKTFGDASKLLLEGTLTEAREVASEALDKGASQAEAVATHAVESYKTAAKTATETFKGAADNAAE